MKNFIVFFSIEIAILQVISIKVRIFLHRPNSDLDRKQAIKKPVKNQVNTIQSIETNRDFGLFNYNQRVLKCRR